MKNLRSYALIAAGILALLAAHRAVAQFTGISNGASTSLSLNVPQQMTVAKQFIAESAAAIINGGHQTYTCSVSVGSLPTGLSISTGTNACLITGTPTGTGTSNFTLKVVDSSHPPLNTSVATHISVASLSSSASTPNPVSIAHGATQQLTATGTYSDSTTFNLTTLGTWTSSVTTCATVGSATGIVTGAASPSGCPSNVTMAFHGVTSANDSVTVSSGAPNINTTSIPDALINVPSGQFQFTASGGTPPYTWTTTSGAILTGLSLSSGGLLTGTCTAAAASQAVTIKVTDNATNTGTKALTQTCASLSSIAVTFAANPITSGSQTQATATGTYSDALTSPYITQGSQIGVVGTPQGASDLSGSTFSTLAAPAVNVATGQTVAVYCRHSTITYTCSVTDTGSTNTFTGVANETNANVSAASEWFIANNATAVAGDIITCHFSTPDSYDVCIPVVISGAAASALDTHAENFDGSSSGTAPSYVANANYNSTCCSPSTTSTMTVTPGSSVPVGDLQFVWVDWDCGPQDTTDVSCQPTQRTFNSISDTASNVYTQVGTEQGYFGSGGFSDTARIYCTINGTNAANTITATVDNPSTLGTFMGMFVWQYHNVAGGCPTTNYSFTKFIYPPGASSPSTTVNANQNNTVISLWVSGDTAAPTAGAGYTRRYNQGSASVLPIAVEDAVASTTGTQTIPWTHAAATGIGIWDFALSNSTGGPSTSCQSGTFTTTQAAELILDACTAGAHGLTYTSGSGYSILVTDPNGNSAVEGQAVSTIQTGASTNMTISAVNDWINNLITLKAASSSGCQWTTNASGVAAVNGSGLVTGGSVITSSAAQIACTVGAISGNATITVNPASISSITVSPSNPTVIQNGTQQFMATDNLGNNITNSVTWSSSNPSVATITSGGLATACACSSSTTIQASKSGVNGTTTLTVGTLGNASLLSGAIVTSTATDCTSSPTISVSVPAGWSLGCAQSFESGNVGGSEVYTNGLFFANGHGHTGNVSLGMTVPVITNAQNVSPGGSWFFIGSPSLCCVGGEVYISAWAYLDPNAVAETEATFGGFQNGGQGFAMDTQPTGMSPVGQTTTSMDLWMSPQANTGGCDNNSSPKNCSGYGQLWNLNRGTWEQEEMWYKAETCSGSTPNNDGFVRFYLNGVLVEQKNSSNMWDTGTATGGNPNGCVDMSTNGPTPFWGGVFTYGNNSNVTSSFNKYVDDIIILHR